MLGDMNIENQAELQDATPTGFTSLNAACEPTNTNVNKPKPYDHVLFRPVNTGSKLQSGHPFQVENLVNAMRVPWKNISKKKYPGGPPYKHDQFRKYYSDHDPVDFQLTALPTGDND